jgi:hypothetical protein
MTEIKEENKIWIPEHEAALYQEWKTRYTPEQLNRMAYFFWNGFSYEGYPEHLAKQRNQESGGE